MKKMGFNADQTLNDKVYHVWIKTILFLLSVCLLLFGCEKKQYIIDQASFESYQAELRSSNPDTGERLYIKTGESEFEIEMAEIKPWRVDFCNVDGGEIELALGVYKESPLHEVEMKRLFFYNLREDRIKPKYRMSRLTYPFDDYILTDIDRDGRDEIIAIEVTEEGGHMLGGYRWTNFAFERSYSGEEIDREGEIRVENNRLIQFEQEISLRLDGTRIEKE